jgi:Na+-driven multidrug efflux pump
MMNLCLTASMGMVFAAALRFFAPDIGRWMGLDPALNAIATVYLGTISLYFVFMGILVAYGAVLSSRGMTHWLMYVSLTVASLNVTLAYLFVLVWHWGVRGVVSASIASVATATLLAIGLVHGRLKVRFYFKNAWRDMLGVVRPLLRIGVSNALEPFSYCVQQIIISAMIIALGIVSMAANSYAGRAQMFQINFSVSLALGAQILMGHWMGAQRFDDVDQLYWKVIRRAMLVAGLYACTVWLLGNWALGIFTHDEEVKHLGKTLLLVAVFLEPARAVNIIAGFTLKSVGDARFPLIVAFVFMWGIIPVVIFLNHAWGLSLVGFWICFAVDEILRAGINLWRWRTGKWKGMGITQAGRLASEALGDALTVEP